MGMGVGSKGALSPYLHRHNTLYAPFCVQRNG